MALAIAQKPESLSPFQHAEDQTQEKNFFDTERDLCDWNSFNGYK